MRVGIAVHGYIGDCLFASSIAKKLKEEQQATEVHYAIWVKQPLLLMQNNPYIDSVQYQPMYFPVDKLITIGQVDQSRPATIQMQEQAGVRNPSVEYEVYTLEKYDREAKAELEGMAHNYPFRPVVAWQANWKERAYDTRIEMLLETPKRGGPHRDIDNILVELCKDFTMYRVGLESGIVQHDPRAADAESFARTASIIKYCDWMIGAEGGLTNLAAGVGTKCIITTCFIHQVYGKFGFVKQIDNPQMGPKVYFPNAGHVHLEPFIPDSEVLKQIRDHILLNGYQIVPPTDQLQVVKPSHKYDYEE